MPRLKIVLQSRTFVILSLLFIICYIFLSTKIIKRTSIYKGNETVFEGVIIDKKVDGDKLSILLKAKEKLPVTYYFKSEDEKNKMNNDIVLGSKVTVIGNLSEPKNNTIPNTFNYKEYLYNKGIYKIVTANKITVHDEKINFFYRLKNYFIKRANKYDAKGYMQAFVLGDKRTIDSDVFESFKVNGVTHLFAVSGMHVSFLVAGLVFILNKLKFKEKYINIVVVSFLIFYMFLIGFSASIIRSVLLYIFLLINKEFKLGFKTINVLYLIFVLLLIINPFYLYDLGFVYSFLSSFGLILFSKKIKGNYFKKLFLVSMITFLFSLPISISNFYKFNLLAVFSNIVIVPIISLVLFPLTILTFFIPFLGAILGFLFNILEYINYILSLVKIEVVVPKIGFLFIIIYYFIIYFYYKYGYKVLFLIGCLIIFAKVRPYFDSNLYVYFLDVGQGDCTLLISERRKKVIMIDTGGVVSYAKEDWKIRNNNYSLSDNVISFLNSLGLDYLDLLIVTHGDYDHMGEAENLVTSLKVGGVIFNQGSYNDLEKELIKKLEKENIKYYSKAKELNVDGTKLQFLNTDIYDNENDNSNVTYFSYDNYKFLFMGDASVKVEENLMKKYNLQNIDFLKVGHHGSDTSSSKNFIDKVAPKYAMISVGKNNRYGHPKNSVLDTLSDSRIYRTDEDGSITLKLKRSKLDIVTCPP